MREKIFQRIDSREQLESLFLAQSFVKEHKSSENDNISNLNDFEFNQ